MAEGYKDFVAADVLTAAQVDDYLMRQAVMRFADSSARDAALASVLTEGLLAYLKDVDVITMYTGSAWISAAYVGAYTIVSGTTDVLQEDGTPCTWNAATGYARYGRWGRRVSGSFVLPITAAGSATNGEAITVSMPVVPRDTTTNAEYVGIGQISDASGPSYYPVAVINASGAFRFKRTDTSTASLVGIDPGFALANGDVIQFNFQYEAAS